MGKMTAARQKKITATKPIHLACAARWRPRVQADTEIRRSVAAPVNQSELSIARMDQSRLTCEGEDAEDDADQRGGPHPGQGGGAAEGRGGAPVQRHAADRQPQPRVPAHLGRTTTLL